MKMSAQLSTCGHYRYALHRTWDNKARQVVFVGLNPSTADAAQDDHTSRVCINYAMRWGFGSLVLVNLFAFRSTDPKGLRQVDDPVGPDNDRILKKIFDRSALVVCAWSNLGAYQQRHLSVLPMIKHPHCLCVLKGGHPGHPLYKSRNLTPTPFSYSLEQNQPG